MGNCVTTGHPGRGPLHQDLGYGDYGAGGGDSSGFGGGFGGGGGHGGGGVSEWSLVMSEVRLQNTELRMSLARVGEQLYDRVLNQSLRLERE